MQLLEAEDARIQREAAKGVWENEPDKTKEVYADIARRCKDMKLAEEQLTALSKTAVAELYNVPKLFSFGGTLEAFQNRFGAVLKSLRLNKGTGPQGLLSRRS